MYVHCPYCLKRYKLPADHAKLLRVHCRGCGREFLSNPTEVHRHELEGRGHVATAVVADIQRDFRNFVIDVMRRQGFGLVMAEDGNTALEVVSERHPDLLLVNPYLPGLMGVDLIARLRELGRAPKAILLMGAIHSSRRYHRRPESLYGADDYLEEGYTEQAVLRKLAYHLHLPLSVDSSSASSKDCESLRLARSVFADLMVYHPEKIARIKDAPGFFAAFPQETSEARRYLEGKKAGAGELLAEVVSQYVAWSAARGGGR